MKKRILSLALALSMLVGMFTVFGTASSAAETGVPSSSGKSASTYLDLYVKDGLVALFTAYGASESDGDATTWTPADYYDMRGYDDYVDPADYTVTFSKGTYLAHKWSDGYVSQYFYKEPTGNRHDDANAYINMDELGAILKANGHTQYTVQEVYQYLAPVMSTNDTYPIVENGVITNYTAAKEKGNLSVTGGSTFGDGVINTWYYSVLNNFGYARLGLYYDVVGGNLNYFFLSSHYLGANCPTELTTDAGATLSAQYYIDGTEMGVFERSTTRLSSSAGNVSYKANYRVAPSKCNTWGAGNDISFTAVDKGSTTLRLLAGHPARIYSVRVYSGELTEAERNMNHFADLCGFYGTGVEDFLSMTAEKQAELIDAASTFMICREQSEYASSKKDFENLVARFAPPLEMEAEEREKNIYDSLYLGADNRKTENGGSLVALYTAYSADDKSVDLDVGLWYNKMDRVDVSITGGKYNSERNSAGWKVREGGGIGYDLLISAPNEDPTVPGYMIVESCNNMLTLSPSLLASPDFTVEYSASFVNYKMADGSEYGTGASDLRRPSEDVCGNPTERIGYLGNYATRAGSISSTAAVIAPVGSRMREMRWYVGKPSENWTAVYTRAGSWSSGQNLWGCYARETTTNYIQTVTRDESTDGNSAAYSIYSNGALFGNGTWTYNPDSDKSFFYYPKADTDYKFELFRQVPVTVYAIRVYSAVLTDAEMKYNRFIDLAAYYGADLTAFKALSTDMRTIVATAMSGIGFDEDRETFEGTMQSTLDQLVFSFDVSSTLYVTDGLTTLLSAYNTVSTGDFKSSDTELLWYNGVGEGSAATLKGTGWKRNANGGYTIVKTVNDYYPPNASTSLYRTKEDYAVVLSGSMLPDADFTVEYVANPVGLSKEDGTRYVDATSRAGIYHENSVAIGPLRAMQFVAPRSGSQMFERRWVYGTGTDPYAAAINKGTATGGKGDLPGYQRDYDWDGIGLNEVITMSITLSTISGDHSYNFYKDSENLGTALIQQGAVITPDKADNRMFRLMGGFAGTVYSVRVYNRVLSEAEMAQNHFADLVYFYNIDISALRDAMEAMGDISAIAAAFTDMGFDMTKEAAQAYFDAHMAEIWLTYNGYAVRGDLRDGLRFYFDINENGINSMLGVDAHVEIGTLINIGKSATPLLEGYAYDYKVVAYDSDMGKAEGIFVDDDTYAVTVRYENADKNLLLKGVSFHSYVKLVMSDGTTLIYYLNTTGSSDNIFEYYGEFITNNGDALDEDEALEEYLSARKESCYTTTYVYLDAAASEGGDGSEEAPFVSFEDAFASVKQSMREAILPTHIILSAKDGAYSVSEVQTLTEEDKAYAYTDLTMISENGGAILSTTENMTESFTSLGGNLYSYQFKKDENGNYPEFRHLYVDGKMATLGHQGGIESYLGDVVAIGYDRPFNAVFQTAMDNAEAGTLTFTSALPANYASRSDLAEVYNYYRPRAIAYWEVVNIYNSLTHGASADFATDSAKLANATPSKGAGASASDSAAYTATFAEYKMKFLARYEVECYAHDYGPRSTEFAAVNTANTNTDYVSFFKGVRDYLASTAKTKYTDTVFEYPIELPQKSGYLGSDFGKIYVSEELVGGLRDLIASGKEAMVKYVDDLTAELDALYASTKADSDVKTALAADALAVYVALNSLSEVGEADFVAALDAKITEATNAFAAAATEEEKHKATVLLDAYNALKTAIEGKDALTVYAQVLESKRIASAEAEEISVAKATEARNLKSQMDEHATLAAEVKDTNLWVRHALTPYHIEYTIKVHYMMNVNDITGVDYDDYYVDEKGVMHYACYVAGYENIQVPARVSIESFTNYLTNNLKFVDSENEYYYDIETGTLYYYSTTGVDGKTFARPTCDNLLKFVGVDDLRIEGFSFTGIDDYHMTVYGHNGTLGSGDYDVQVGRHLFAGPFPDRAAIYLKDITNLAIERCSFYEIGCEAITARGWMENALVNECFFENIGGSAIRFGENIRNTEIELPWIDGVEGNKDIVITENYLHNISRNYLTPALQVTTCLNGLVQYNTVEYCTYTAISVGWQWAYSTTRTEILRNVENMEIANNFVRGFMSESYDGGGIYVAGPNSAASDPTIFNSMHDNYVLYDERTGNGKGGFNPGIYFDGATTAYHCYKNVIVEPGYGAHASESDYADYGVSDYTAGRLQAARKGASSYIYLQHIVDQEVHNILLEDNIILNVRSKDKADQRQEIYNSYLDIAIVRDSNVIEYNTVYVVGMSPDVLPREATVIIPVAGATGYNGDIEEIVDNVY